MNKLQTIKAFETLILISGVFDLFGGVYFTVLVGADRSITNPPTHSFYAILIGMFLVCFAYLQFMTAIQIKRCLFNVGVVILSRAGYAILFFSYFLFAKDFPTTFLPTAIVDLVWVMLYLTLALINREVRLRDLFIQSPTLQTL